MCVWARTTTGQAIYADAVFEAIAAELAKDDDLVPLGATL